VGNAQKKETIKVDGALVHIELVPNTGYVKGIAPLDGKGQVIVNGRMQSEVPYVLAPPVMSAPHLPGRWSPPSATAPSRPRSFSNSYSEDCGSPPFYHIGYRQTSKPVEG
jgi:hypothetical protein